MSARVNGTESVLLDGAGLPRFWANVWASFEPADAANSTIAKKLGHVESFYRHVDSLSGVGSLDAAIADFDVERLCGALEGYYLALRNRPPITAATDERWRAAIRFVLQTTERLYRSTARRQKREVLQLRLSHLQLLNAHLHIGRRRDEEQIRSLPAVVLAELYEVLDPDCPRNPFKRFATRWRVYLAFMLLLHQGLRRGELLGFPADVVKCGYDHARGEERYWMTIRYNEYEEDDPRFSKPSIKTASSIRQIPVSKPVALVVQEYVTNFRGKPNHSFLMNSQKKMPLSTEAITKMFQQISDSLPKGLRKALADSTGQESVRAHDLRHTCAVVRLNQLLRQGVSMEDALQRLRSFFGWARSSEMPLRYARASFEERLATVWNAAFDERIEILRNLSSTPK